eukprot:Polyplicarium_translucidae@DN1267_c0_g1_i1.p1
MFCCCAPAVAEEAPEMIQVQARGTIGQLEEWSHKNRLKRAETECARSENDRRRAQMSTERAALVRQKGELEEALQATHNRIAEVDKSLELIAQDEQAVDEIEVQLKQIHRELDAKEDDVRSHLEKIQYVLAV